MHRPGFATCGNGRFHRGEQAVGELTFAVLERLDHGLDHRTIGQHVARRHALFARHGIVVAQGLRAAEVRGAAEVVDGGDLPVLAVAVAGQHLVQRVGRREALFHEGEDFRAEGRQGDVLRGHRADTGQQPGQRAPTAMLEELIAMPN
jgi:hypothetical protein